MSETDRRPGDDPPSSRRLGVLLQLWRFARPYRLQVAGALIALTVAATTVLLLGFGLRLLVDEGFASGNVALLDRAVMIFFGVILVMASASYGRFYLVSWIGERVVADMRRAVFDHVLTLSPAFFEVRPVGEILSRLTTDTTLLQTVVGTSLSMALRNVLLLFGGTVLLIVTSLKLTGLVFLVVPVVVLPILAYGRRVRRLSRASQDRIADVGIYIDETLGAIRTVQSFGHEPHDRRLFAARVEEAFATAVRRISARAILTAFVIVLAFAGVSVVLWIGGRDMLAGRISAGDLSAFIFYAVVVAGAVGALSEVVGDLQRAAGATERLLELLDSRSEITVAAQPVALPQRAEGAVRFEDVVFRYPARPEQSALDHFSTDIAPGEAVALVGPSGAGKTTVLQLLLRFYDPQQGRITLDGVDLRDAAPDDLRSRIALVPQDPVIFSANAWENIRYGNPAASDAEVREAAEAAAALHFLEQLPDGLNTFLGEKGVRLSGGQRQRLAIARAILKDPSVLLLDEATSALDAESEQAVQKALERLMSGRTTLAVAHRLATVLKAERILVLDQGRIVESGKHADLSRAGGLYARLAALQFGEAAALAEAAISESA